MDLHLSSLSAVGFRGIRKRLDLRFGRRLTIIYGGNATGKSSIAQAIEFVLTGQVVDQEENPIPPRYLNNSMATEAGTVSLGFTSDAFDRLLSAATHETRSEIEHRFRDVGLVDWPERQQLPITTTHITSQGALARVLATDAVTRNDLSGLCAGPQLRLLLARASRLSDHFRQATIGRNIQTEIKDARAAHESARVLRDSLLATRGPDKSTPFDPLQAINELAASMELPKDLDISRISTEIDARVEKAEQRFSSIQRLLIRMRELGQYEVELSQLRIAVNEAVEAENALLANREEVDAALAQLRSQAQEVGNRQAQAAAMVAAYEREQQLRAMAEALRGRLVHTQSALADLRVQRTLLEAALESAAVDESGKGQLVLRLQSERTHVQRQAAAVDQALFRLADVPDSSIAQATSRHLECDIVARDLRARLDVARAELQQAREEEITAADEFSKTSESESRFAAAVVDLKAVIDGDACSLCGHRHGSREALEAAILSVTATKLGVSSKQRQVYERLTEARRILEHRCEQLQTEVHAADAAVTAARTALDQLHSRRQAVVSEIQQSFVMAGLQVSRSLETLASMRDDLVSRAAKLDDELQLATQAELESRVARNDVETEFVRRTAEQDQLTRITRELQEQTDALGLGQSEPISPDSLSLARQTAADSENASAELQRQIGKTNAQLTEIDRLLIEKKGQRSGAQRRLDVIDGLLRNIDQELESVGASRDVGDLVQLESATRQERERGLRLKERAGLIRQRLGEMERNRALTDAERSFRDAQEKLELLQRRHSSLSKRAAQFAELRLELERAQSQTAESVLKNVREPVGTMFRAMTAGCQWDIQFALTETGGVEARLVDPRGGAIPAGAVLNSAYLNVSAVALRIALASQQNWTALRTIVLDDPILEMDSLTQSALIDGLEAILVSGHSPWRNLQLIITTWSEDFAILAAHKLAHMNASVDVGGDQFVLYRLGCLPDGSATPERHVPRWKTQANAA